MTDDPPAGVQVLSFQVSVTAAALTPENGPAESILYNNMPVRADLTQLQALSALLSYGNVDKVTTGSPGFVTYTGLSLTFADPRLVLYNQSDALLGSGCPVGAVCQLTPALENGTTSLSFNSSPFPVTMSPYMLSLDFPIDFHLNAVIQPDLSLNLAAANGVTLSELPSLLSDAPLPQVGFVTGTVIAAWDTPNVHEFYLQTASGMTLDIDASSTAFFNNFPTGACTTPGLGCVALGQIVRVSALGIDGTGAPDGASASEVDYVQGANEETLQGTIIQLLPSGFTMIVHSNPTSATEIPLGGEATVTTGQSVTYSIDTDGVAMPSGLNFASASDLTVGQNVAVTVSPGTLTTTGSGPGANAWGPPPSISFTASVVELEPSQLTATITATDPGMASFTLDVASPFFAPWPLPSAVSSFHVATTSQTNYAGDGLDGFAGLATNDFVSVNGWLFPPGTGSGSPTVVAQSVLLRPSQVF
jgi:hypothetical protein